MKVAISLMCLVTACAAVRTPEEIAYVLRDCLRMTAKDPLGVRCQCVRDAERRCALASYPTACAWSKDVDKDHDAFSVYVCKSNR